MGLAEVFCENVENMWKWIEDNREDASGNKELIVDYLITCHLTIQLLLGNRDPENIILARIRNDVLHQWYRVVVLGESVI